MSYWIERIALASGEIVTEQELREDENRFEGPCPAAGDVLEVQCRGRKFAARIIWAKGQDRAPAEDVVVRLRVAEVGLDPKTPLWLLRKVDGRPDLKVSVGSLD